MVQLGKLRLWTYSTSIEPTGPLYSWLTNNKWETNFRLSCGGAYDFRYVIQMGRFRQRGAGGDPCAAELSAAGDARMTGRHEWDAPVVKPRHVDVPTPSLARRTGAALSVEVRPDSAGKTAMAASMVERREIRV